MFRVWMIFDFGTYVYGIYDTRDKANEVAEEVREERDCDIYIEEV